MKLIGQSTGEYDFSSYFTIVERKIELSQPRSDDIFIPHTTQIIDWHSIGIGTHVRIDLYLNSTYILEIENNYQYPDSKRYYWEVWQGENYSSITDSNYQIRIQDTATPKFYDFSSSFTIVNEKYLKITSPEENSSFRTGSTIDITWETDTPYHTVSIDLMKDGVSVLQIAKDANNIRTFT